MVTIYDIAKKTGYSVTTVSKAINNYSDVSKKTKKAIMDAIDEMGYLPNSSARTLSTKKSWTIGVVFVESLGIGMKHPFFNAVIESFRQNVEVLGYDLLFASRTIANRQKSYLEHFRYRGVDGVVIICSTYDDKQVQELLGDSIPTVVIDLSSEKSSVVFSDNVSGSRMAVEYLHSLGHRKIAHIAGHQNTFAGQQRLKGYMDALTHFSLDKCEDYIVDGEYFSKSGGYKAMVQLLSLEDRPTAVFAAGDNLAVGAIEAIKDNGYNVPDDFSIVGFDDIDLAKYTSPSLTTIKQNTDLIGKEASQLLVKQMNDKNKVTEEILVPVDLIERKSCRKISF